MLPPCARLRGAPPWARSGIARQRAGIRVIGAERWRRWTDRATFADAAEAPAPGPRYADRSEADIRRDQRLRLHRFRLAAIGYCFLFSVTGYLWLGGQLDLDFTGMVAFVASAFALNVVFAGMIVSRRNLALRDPSMTTLQTLAVVLIVLVLGWLGNTVVAQDTAVMALEVGLLFGMFRLGVRELAVLAGIAFVGFSFIALMRDPALGLNIHETIVRLVITGGVLAWTTVFASYVGQLRRRISSRNAELRSALSKLEELAKHDGLTGIFNRREVFRQLDEALDEGLRLGVPVSISLFDLDSFKTINDRYGHSVGDAVLREFVNRVKTMARSLDRLGRVAEGAGFGRYGGEEFLMVMPMTPLEGAREAAERIREAVARKPFMVEGNEVYVTVSQGVAEAGRRERVEHLLARADRALYSAKREGRDCVRLAEEYDDSDMVSDEPSFFNLNGGPKPG